MNSTRPVKLNSPNKSIHSLLSLSRTRLLVTPLMLTKNISPMRLLRVSNMVSGSSTEEKILLERERLFLNRDVLLTLCSSNPSRCTKKPLKSSRCLRKTLLVSFLNTPEKKPSSRSRTLSENSRSTPISSTLNRSPNSTNSLRTKLRTSTQKASKVTKELKTTTKPLKSSNKVNTTPTRDPSPLDSLI